MTATGREPSTCGHSPELAAHLHLLNVAAANFALEVRAELDVGAQGYLALQHLVAAGPEVGLKELGELLDVSSSACTLLVNRLEKAGHLRRRRHPYDRRRTNVLLTDSTRCVLEAANESVSDVVGGATRHLHLRDHDVIEQFLAVVARTYEDATISRQRRTRLHDRAAAVGGYPGRDGDGGPEPLLEQAPRPR